MSFPKYSAYKDSGVEWLRAVPEHWAISRFKQIFSERGERSGDGSEDLLSVSAYYGVKRRAETLDEGDHLSRAESLEGYKVCYAGDLVMNIMLAWNRGLGFAWINGIVSPAYSVFRVIDDSDPRYLDYLVRSDEMTCYFKAFSAGVIDSRLRLYPETFGRLYAAFPPIVEQTQIARFLDHETARIDALIEEQQRLIELLKEKRQAVISHAVTKGLDPTVPMKDSGVEWLGEVPEHWDVKNMKHISSLKGRLGWQGLKAEEYREKGPFVVSSAHFNNFTIDWDACPHVSGERYDLDSNIQLCEGDVLLMKDGAALGKLAYIDHLPDRACLNSHLLLFRPLLTNQCITYISRFLFFLMRTEYFQKHITLYATGTTFAGISQEKIGNYRVALPPLEEQNAIVKFLEVEIAKFDLLTTEAQRTTDLLRERRSALISAAVTGKIDVRGWRAPASAPSPELENETV